MFRPYSAIIRLTKQWRFHKPDEGRNMLLSWIVVIICNCYLCCCVKTVLINTLFIHTQRTETVQFRPSCKADRFAASQEIPCILWTTKVNYRIHKCPPTVPILIQLDPVHTPTSHLLKIRINIILSSTPGSFKWSLTFRFPHQNPVHTFPLPYTCYMPRLTHSSLFYHTNNIGWAVQIIKLLIM